ncbi:PfkB family carbohydrate kinase [Sorangium cellulosum]|uniref:PfkB family carbohydrate kinase n=1 Tax=Sorangium cellulosum TaxID=56 RepID=UPI001011B057|nr:PfkB family carbohydrate kinase [Sorangium cellulosum]
MVCVGEALWDFYAPEGIPLEQAKLLRRVPGGGAVNTATALARLGVPSGLCAALGDDAMGRGLRDEVAAAGIDVGRLALGAARTGLMLVAIERGEARFVGYRQGELEARALAAALPARWQARVVHFTGIAPVRGAIGALVRAAAAARREGCAVSVDINARPRMWPRAGRSALPGGAGARPGINPGAGARPGINPGAGARPGINPGAGARPGINPGATRGAGVRGCFRLFGQADLVKCSTGDLEVLGTTAPALRKHLRAEATLVVTDGARETLVLGPGGERAVAPRPVRPLDPTGAGDAFCAGMLATLVWQGRDRWTDAALMLRAVARGHDVARAWVRRKRG